MSTGVPAHSKIPATVSGGSGGSSLENEDLVETPRSFVLDSSSPPFSSVHPLEARRPEHRLAGGRASKPITLKSSFPLAPRHRPSGQQPLWRPSTNRYTSTTDADACCPWFSRQTGPCPMATRHSCRDTPPSTSPQSPSGEGSRDTHLSAKKSLTTR